MPPIIPPRALQARPNMSVLVPTYNRGEQLRGHLETLLDLEQDGDVEFLIIDNNSSDATPAIIREYARRGPIKYLYAATPGKSAALNAALRAVELGELIVFTDDDVQPARDWLREISEASRRWPQHAVFGGSIELGWPRAALPSWSSQPAVQELLARHVFSAESPYPPGKEPFGPNFWVRREVLKQSQGFSERLGPHPGYSVLGEETLLLRQLRAKGFEPVHVPTARVVHLVRPAMLRRTDLISRAFQLGRGNAHVEGLPDQDLWREDPRRWRWRRARDLVTASARLLAAAWPAPLERQIERALNGSRGVGHHFESLRLSFEAPPGHP